ncbi:hypothetical protein [Anatilimnocola floriformis]|uniref:hypothetical protein n=1 Tax=Anatilimnocola floriformis TaxID=2948575 RepID=UPI0020C36F0E|nr:hypothetical protein [Anatilimnocola floriformis]
MSTETNAPTDPGLLARRVWLAPICLCLVAAVHLYRVATAGQTPWKGGSFGMFSTIDSEGARFVHAYVQTAAGRTPVQIPNDLDKKVAELRAAPNQELADEIARRLAKRYWFDPQLRQAQLNEQLRRQPVDVPLTGERLREMRRGSAVTNVSLPTTVLAATSDPESAATIPFDLVRVEVWKQTMSPGTTRLVPQLLFFSSLPITEKRP